MLIVILVIIGLSFLVLAHEAGHFFVAKLFGLKIEEFGFGFPPEMFGASMARWKLPVRIFGQKKGETLYSINWIPFGGFVKIAGENPSPSDEGGGQATIAPEEQKRLFRYQPAWRRASVLFAGVLVNFVVGWLLISTVLAIGSPSALFVSDVQKNSPAEKAGIITGDLIQGFTKGEEFISFIKAHRGENIALNIKRGSKELSFNVVPRVNPPPGEGAVGIGFAEGGAPKESLPRAFYDGLKLSFVVVGQIFVSLYQLIKSLVFHASLLEGVVGPIGIISVAAQTGQLGFVYFAQIIALISINLAVINFIPFPALDGGQFFLVLIEKIKGSPLFSKEMEAFINTVGFVLLILLLVVISVRDVSRWL